MSVIKRDDQGDVDRERTWAFEERRLRRRQVYAQELMAIALLAPDIESEEVVAIRATAAYRRLIERLTHGAPT